MKTPTWRDLYDIGATYEDIDFSDIDMAKIKRNIMAKRHLKISFPTVIGTEDLPVLTIEQTEHGERLLLDGTELKGVLGYQIVLSGHNETPHVKLNLLVKAVEGYAKLKIE